MVGKSTNPQNEASAMERITNGSCRRLRTNLQAILSRTNNATRPIIKIAGISWIGTATSTTATTSTLQQRRIGLLATITPSMHAVQKVTVAVAMAVAALSRPRPCSSKWGDELTYSTGTKTKIKDGISPRTGMTSLLQPPQDHLRWYSQRRQHNKLKTRGYNNKGVGNHRDRQGSKHADTAMIHRQADNICVVICASPGAGSALLVDIPEPTTSGG